jgi:hypothetical protein
MAHLSRRDDALTPRVKRGSDMGWRNLFSPSATAVDADDGIGGAPYAGGGSRSVLETSGVPDDRPPPLSEDIKRRQVALLLRYVSAIRAR